MLDTLLWWGYTSGRNDTVIGYTTAGHLTFYMEANRNYYAWHYVVANASGKGSLPFCRVTATMPWVVVARA